MVTAFSLTDRFKPYVPPPDFFFYLHPMNQALSVKKSTIAAANGRMRWWYDSIIDWMLAHPDGKLGECALALKKSPSTISIVTNSDVFKLRLEERRRTFNDRHDASIMAKSVRLAEVSLDLQLEVLEKKRDKVPLNAIKEIGESAMARLGYGLKSAPNSVINIGHGAGAQNSVISVSKEALASARESLRAVEKISLIQPPQIVDVEVVEVTVDAKPPD